MPVTIIMNDTGNGSRPFDADAIWSAWAPGARIITVDGGHLIPENRPQQVATALRQLIAYGAC